MNIENEEPGQLAGFQSCVQRLQESIEMMQQSLQKAVQEPKVVYNLSGATIQGSVIGGSITKNGAEYYSGTHAQKVNPGPWGLRVGNHILTMLVIKVTIAFVVHIFVEY